MDSITLHLKIRDNDEVATASVAYLRAIYSQKSVDRIKDSLYEFFKPIRESPAKIHDKHWLKMIVDFVPMTETGQPSQPLIAKLTSLTTLAPWLDLALRISHLTKSSDSLELSIADIDLIWSRLCSPDFRVEKIPTPFAEFLLDFLTATGKSFSK